MIISNFSRLRLTKNGTRIHYNIDDEIHREDGPAVEYPNSNVEYWLNDKQYDRLTHWLLVNKSTIS